MGRFVAFGFQGLRMASTDGRSWSEPLHSDKTGWGSWTCRACIWGGDQFVLLVRKGGETLYLTSPDGVKWSDPVKTEPEGKMVDLAYGNGHYLAIGGHMDGHWTSVMKSTDGKKWSDQKFDKERLLTRVTFGGGKFLACGYRGRVAISENGDSWQDSEELQGQDTFVSVAYANGVYVGGGLHGLRMSSSDGLRWEHREVGEEGQHINSMLWNGREFVGVGLGATFFSRDGRKWRSEPNEDAPVSATFGDGIYVGSKWKGRIMVSRDAVTWQEALRAPAHVLGIAHGG